MKKRTLDHTEVITLRGCPDKGTSREDVSFSGKTLPLSKGTCLMGVLNVTPDSFSDGASHMDTGVAVDRAMKMEEEGASIIDVGGESSRPGASPVTEDEEMMRVVPVIRELRKRCGAVISVDTRKSEVARIALSEGADLINDITALGGDARMAEIISRAGAGVVLMHMKGTPSDMQDAPVYGDVVGDIMSCLSKAVGLAERSGIDPKKIFVDPGIGFGKTIEHNLVLLKYLRRFRELGKPVLVGTSRKSFIGEITGKDVKERVFGTAASVAVSVMNGADVVRVHDVAQMRDVVMVMDAIKGMN